MNSDKEIEIWENYAKNNQYCQYDRLPALLKRCSFDEKMRICYEYSSKILQKGNLQNPESLRGLPLPFPLETFLMLSVEGTEYQHRTFSDKKEHHHFVDMINAIWHHTPCKLFNLKSQDFIDWYLSLAPLTQFFYQQNYWILYYRLTEGNNTLRSLLGKNVIEQYVFEIVQQSHCYTDVRREITYSGPRGTHAQSPDIIAHYGNSILLLECKSTVPGVGMRTISDETYCKTQKQLAKQIVQLYKSVQHFVQYNPFDNLSISKDDIWGCVVLLEYPHIRRKNVYPHALDSLNISEGSNEAAWIMRHIKIIDLYQLELLCLSSNSIIDAVKKTNSTGDITAIPLEVPENLQLTNPIFLQFCKSVIEQIKKEIP